MFGALVVLLLLSAFFSIAETAMMAINRYRLKHLVSQDHPGRSASPSCSGAPTGCSAAS
jgi:Mg2+/Co2+ transporter CorB